MKKTPYLQIGIYIACGIGVILAIAIFSGKLPVGKSASDGPAGTVTMWGVLPSQVMRDYIANALSAYPELRVTYVQKDARTLQSDLVNALASGVGPDLVTVSPSDIIANKDRLLPIPYTSLPLQTFQNTFVDQASLFTRADGILAIPLVIDPMVMYYNKDLLTSAFAVKPPSTWDEVTALNKQLTQKDDGGVLSVETIAMGTFDNIAHAKDLVAMITLQAGGTLIGFDEMSKKYIPTLTYGTQAGGYPFAIALDLFTSFAKSTDPDRYSWNASLPLDTDQFVAGKLALYFGYGSELATLRKKNPNLNFNVAMVPQSSRRPTKATYGKMIGLAVTKMSKQPALSVLVANQLAQKESLQLYLDRDSTLAPARKDMLAEIPESDALRTLVYRSAIISKNFLDPDPSQTSLLFKKIIDQINAGVMSPEMSMTGADSLMKSILEKVQK
jgi:ABC-type glycerol-3-phosphate transport system substrate-binding protein